MIRITYPFRLFSCLLVGNQLLSATAFLSPKVFPSHVASSASRHLRFSLINLLGRAAESDDAGDTIGSSSDLSWLKDAMDAPSTLEPDGLVLMETQQGISGFSVDPQRGFVVVLVGGDRATYAVVSPKDRQEVRSAEALCLVQLAGGLDLGTPILPPDILARLVADETGRDARELRRLVKLERVDVVANPNQASPQREITSAVPPESSPARDAAIEEQVSKVALAVQKLPGLEECTLEQVREAMKLHANEEGQVDRQAFTELLHTLRSQLNDMEPSKVIFNLVVAVEGEDAELCVQAPSAVTGVGLALRYNVDVVVSDECQVEGFDVVEIASRFPAFRPLKHLEEDARIMDGFIPQMFNEATLDNDDKM